MSTMFEGFVIGTPKNTMLENPNHFEIQGFEGKFQIENPDQKPNFQPKSPLDSVKNGGPVKTKNKNGRSFPCISMFFGCV